MTMHQKEILIWVLLLAIRKILVADWFGL